MSKGAPEAAPRQEIGTIFRLAQGPHRQALQARLRGARHQVDA
jgi:hypothetical protein